MERKGDPIVKRMQKRIALNRETLRRLNPEEISGARGGYNYSTLDICPTYGCNPTRKPCTETC